MDEAVSELKRQLGTSEWQHLDRSFKQWMLALDQLARRQHCLRWDCPATPQAQRQLRSVLEGSGASLPLTPSRSSSPTQRGVGVGAEALIGSIDMRPIPHPGTSIYDMSTSSDAKHKNAVRVSVESVASSNPDLHSTHAGQGQSSAAVEWLDALSALVLVLQLDRICPPCEYAHQLGFVPKSHWKCHTIGDVGRG
jgi:hypothetical protein